MNTEPIGFKEDADFQLKKDILLECIGTSDNLEFELIPGEVLSFMVFQAMDKYAAERSKKMAVALQKWTDFTDKYIRNISDAPLSDSFDVMKDWQIAYNESQAVLKEAGLNP